MYMRSLGLGLLAAVIFATGCGKSPADATSKTSESKGVAPAPPPPPPVETVARLHWLGKKRLATETNAAHFMSIWSLPESGRLEAQVLDKLAMAPWRLLGRNLEPAALAPASGNSTNQPTANRQAANPPVQPASDPSLQTTNPPLAFPATLLRPLLADLVEEESYLEIRNATNLPGELALAIKLDDARAALWETNLAAALESLTGCAPAPAPEGLPGWSWHLPPPASGDPHLTTNRNEIPLTPAPLPKGEGSPRVSSSDIARGSFTLTRSGSWSLLSLTVGNTNPPSANSALAAVLAQISTNAAPPPTNYWVDLLLDPPRVASALACSWNLPADFPRISLTLIGDGQNVRTRGHLQFREPIPFEVEPWQVPTNLINEPLVSFTAIRGIRPWLLSLKAWNDLELGNPPNQFYAWSQEGIPFQTFCAAPMPNASNVLQGLSQHLLRMSPSWVEATGLGKFQLSRDALAWLDLGFLVPYLKAVASPNFSVLFGGLVRASITTSRPPPEDLLSQLSGSNTLACYDWELTGIRAHAWTDIGQLCRLNLKRAQLPFDCASLAFLRAAESKLGNCITTFEVTGPEEITFIRKSSAGLSALEFHVLADWLESPSFPLGFRTLIVQPEPVPPGKPLKSSPSNSTDSAPLQPSKEL